jgi:hypothetical protein
MQMQSHVGWPFSVAGNREAWGLDLSRWTRLGPCTRPFRVFRQDPDLPDEGHDTLKREHRAVDGLEQAPEFAPRPLVIHFTVSDLSCKFFSHAAFDEPF